MVGRRDVPLSGSSMENFLVFFLLSSQWVLALIWIWGLHQESHVMEGYELA